MAAPQSAPESSRLPSYTSILSALHRAHEAELTQIIEASPISPGARVIDVCCGDGAYTLWLAQRVGPHGGVVGIDIDRGSLRAASSRLVSSVPQGEVCLLEGDAASLPIDADDFDVAWCAHSLYDLSEPMAVLTEMKRVVRPHGAVCVLENDRMHHALLPWPPEVELALQRGYRQAVRRKGRSGNRFYVARELPGLLLRAGLHDIHLQTHTTTRLAPLDDDERIYLDLLIDEIARTAWPYLSGRERHELEQWRAGDGDAPSFDDPSFTVTYLDVLAYGRVPHLS